MFVGMHVCKYICTYVYMYVRTCVRPYVCDNNNNNNNNNVYSLAAIAAEKYSKNIMTDKTIH